MISHVTLGKSGILLDFSQSISFSFVKSGGLDL